MKFNDLKIGVRLGFGFGMLSVLIVVTIILSVSNLSNLNKEVDDLANDKFPKTVWATSVMTAIGDIDREMRNLAISNDPFVRQKADEKIKDGAKVATEALTNLENTIKSDEGTKLINDIKDARVGYYAARDKYYAALDSNARDLAVHILFNDLKSETEKYSGAIVLLNDYQDKLVDDASKSAFAEYESARTILIGLGIGAVIIAIFVAIVIIKSITGPISQAVTAANEIANGNTKVDLATNKKDETGQLLNAMKTMADNIDSMIADGKTLAEAAGDGDLKVRTDTRKYKGEYLTLISGMNNILDAVTTPLNEAAHVLSTMANGDLRSRMTGNYQGEFEEFKENINLLGNSLETVISQVIEASVSVASSSEQIAQISGVLATSSQEQSAQSEEVASAVEEMARTINENAENAGKTASVAEQNGKVANEGGSVVKNTVQKMRDIAGVVSNSTQSIIKLGESSKQIGEIISVIDDIADQTNLLALNAAIEAARAGDQGRGFAVVADEVRKLAERTTEATKQIEQMIKNIQHETQDAVTIMNNGNNEVNNGIELADRAGQALDMIVTSTNEVIQMISQIAVASEEQSSTSEQIAKSVESISKVANDSTRQISEVAIATESMTELTQNLKRIISRFKINEGGNNSYSNGNGKNGNGKSSANKFKKVDKEQMEDLMEVSVH
jgi:methyl-accepting chemotaxis protein